MPNTTDSSYSQKAKDAFDAAVREAELGYDIAFLETHTRQAGRPLTVGTRAAATVPVRLDPDRIAAVDQLAARNHETRSDVIRRAIDRELASA
ncbi:MAG: ribbon-helix-helix domain-containing protein [Propionibacteriaceae bacterium]|jgi:hypothetical protein|nr:ribbon-helix-helix domain-containing protein [Propionibacteriaceae bacterium]